jgi:pimeloyl-ACP methyl ester carboxylesterase
MTHFSHYYLVANGIRFHIAAPEAQGSGALVVLLHGFPEFWYSWRHQIPALSAAGYHVIAPDLRGYNDTEKPARGYDLLTLTSDIAEIIKSLRYSRAIIVGHDWGGVLAWTFAARFPEMTSKLVVMNAPHMAAYQREMGRNFAQWRKSWYVYFFQIPRLPEALLTRNHGAGIKQLLRRSASPDTFSEEDLTRYAEAFCKPGAATATINWYRAAARHVLTRTRLPNGGRVSAPTLLLWGARDAALDIGQTEGLERWVSHLTVRILPDASHWVQQDAPDMVNRYLLDFLRNDLPAAAGK